MILDGLENRVLLDEYGDRLVREAPYELLAAPPESPLPAWKPDAYSEALLLYAHPDDEVLFAGGLMLRYPNWQWSLVCVTGNEERQAQNLKALNLLREEGVRCTLVNLGLYDEYTSGGARRWMESIRMHITYVPQVVFTHGARGEYGHHHHVWLNQIAHVLYPNVWDFLNPCWRVKQLAKTIVREVPTDARKAEIFDVAYGSIAAGLRAHAPWLAETQLTGRPEFFTQGVVGV